jgi:hypothetical protein
LIVDEEFAGAAWLPAQFRFASAKFDIHVGIVIQNAGYVIQILRPIPM